MTDTVLIALLVLIILGGLWVLWAWVAARSRGSSPVAETAYARGLNHLIAGDRRGALIAFREAVIEDTTNTDAYLRLGDLLRVAGEHAKALQLHRDLSVRPDLRPADRERVYQSLTRDYLALNRSTEALESARKLRGVNRKNRYALEAMVSVHEREGAWDQAYEVQAELARLDGRDEKKRLAAYQGFVALGFLSKGNRTEARKRLDAALGLDPGCLLAHLELGNLAMEDGDHAGAVEHWKTMATRSPAAGRHVFEKLERAYFEMGRFSDVIRFYEDLLRTAPRETQPSILLALSEIEMRRGDHQSAEDLIREALEIAPDDLVAHRGLLRVYQERGDSRQALSVIDRILKLLDERPGHLECRKCGVELERPVFRCPSCSEWMPVLDT